MRLFQTLHVWLPSASRLRGQSYFRAVLRAMRSKNRKPRFVVCVKNEDCEDLEIRKIYRVLPDEAAAEDGYIRVIDESGEDYLYPSSYFFTVDLPQEAEDALLSAA